MSSSAIPGSSQSAECRWRIDALDAQYRFDALQPRGRGQPNDDTNYVNSATAGQVNLYKYPSLSISGVIAGVQITMCARKDDAGARTVSAECRSTGGTNYAGGSSFNPTPGYLTFRQLYDTDPATGSQWTLSGVNNGQFGVNCVA